MKKIVSLVLAATVVSVGVMHAAKQNYVDRKASYAHMTRSIEANPLVTAIVAAEEQLATDNVVRTALKTDINAALKVLLDNNSSLEEVSTWCDGLETGVTKPNGRQLIADILAMYPVLREALRLLAAEVPNNDDLQSEVSTKLSAFKEALAFAKNKNSAVAAALATRSELDGVFVQSLNYLRGVLVMLGVKVAQIPIGNWCNELSSWDELGVLLNGPKTK